MIWFFQRAIWPLGRGLFKFFLHFKVKGLENLPDPKKQCLIIANHRNYLDAFLVCAAFPFKYYLGKKPIRFMALRKFCHIYTLGWFIGPLGAYPIDQGINDTNISLTPTFKLIKKGQNILIFPEGGRQFDGNPGITKRGIAHLTRETNLPILPVAIKGSLGIKPHLFFLRRKNVEIEFGKSFYYKDLVKEEMDDKSAAQIIMAEVNKML